uniref:Dystrophin-1 n=1 Tax=Ascaris suum TaxID=6253 RepID=F1KPP3_ASCSU
MSSSRSWASQNEIALKRCLKKTRQCDEKIIDSESAVRQFRERLDSLKSEQLEFPELIGHFRKLRDDLQKGRLLQKESAEMAEEIASLVACSNAANRDAILDDLKKRTRTCANAWKSIEENIDESINLLEKENKRFQKGLLRDYRCAVEDLARAIDGSVEAADAEEFSEHLDNLERLSEKLEAAANAVNVDPHGEDSLSREAAEIKTLHDRTVTRAKERIGELECAIRGCEQFESSLAECQAWCNHVQLILSCRAANDVSALDVPHEYKSAFTTGTLISQLQAEFDDFERCIRSLRDFVTKNASDWGSSERLQLQLDHVASQFEELMKRFVEFKQPIGLEEKAERIARETAEMENSVDELTGLEANACISALDHARQIGRRIAQVKADLQDLVESEKKLVDERILGPSAEQEVTKKLQETAIKLNAIEERSTDIVRRLEKCVALLEHLNSDLSHLDAVLDDVESKLSALVQSENVEVTEGDRSTLETLQNELIRNEASLASIEETAESLRRESIKVDDAEVERRWKRIRRVHGDLRAWIDALNSMSEDGRSMLTQFEALYTKLEKTITEMEAIESIEELSTALEQNRAEKSVLMERYRRLLKTNVEVEAKFSLRLSQLEGRWNELEKWWQRARSSPPRAPSPPQLCRIPIEGHFDHQIDTLYRMFKIAKDYIDFERYPVSSVTEWATRIQDVSEWLSEYGDRLKLLLEEGRRLASSGRMELDVHDALESLDKVVDLANQVESGVKASSALLVPVQAKADALARDMRTMRDVLNHLAARDLSEPTIASATQRDLLDRQVQLEYLHRKSDDLHRCLPGLSPNQVNTSMDEICELVRTIEEQIAIAIRKGADEEADRSLGASTPSQPKDSTKEHDTISLSSAGAPSLALEVQETEDERSRLEYLSKSSAPPTIKIENTDSMGSFYIEMDQIEEALSKDDPFPYSDLDAKKQQLEAMSRSLDRVEQAIDDSQMMMDLIESEAARERVAALRDSNSQRTKEVNEMLRSWASLEANLNASDELVKALDTMLSDVDGRNKSPDVDELESLSLSFEDSLQRALAQIQHTSLKAEPIITQMDDEHADVLRERLRDIGERWKRCEDAVRDKRRRLDERLADQSELTNQIELLEFWCDEAEAECATAINSLNDGAIAEISDRINERLSDFESKRESLHNIERLKDRLVNAQLADPSTKHRTRRIVSELGKRVSSIRSVLMERKVELDAAADSAKQFQTDISTLQQFCDRCEKAVQIVENAKIFVPSGTDLDYVRSRQDQMDSLTNSLQERWKKACLEEPPPDDRQKIVIEDVFRMWAKAKQRISNKADVQTLAQDSSLSEAVAVEEFPSETKRALTPSGPEEKAEQSVSEYGTLSEAPMSDEPPLPHLSHKEHALLNSIVQLRHWLAETERDAGLTVDIIDVQAVRDSVNHMQAFIDQLKIRHLELIRILDESQTRAVREKTEFTLGEWNRVLSECQRRKSQLKKMADESRAWEQLRCSVQLWLNDAQQRLSEGGKVSELSEEALRAELKEVEGISGGIEEMKNKMTELNVRSNALLDEFRADEGHNLSHSISKMNTLWSKFNDNIRIRHAVLEAAIRARSDFHSALSQLEQWLDRVESSLSSLNGATMNKQTLKDSVKRKEWIDNEKSIRAEMDAHDDVVRSVEQMGVKLVRSVEDLNERERLGDRLNSVSERWRCMSALADNIRTRLMSAQEECERLVSQLSENIYWCDSQNNALLDEQPVGGSLARVQQQNEFVKNLEHEIDRRQRGVDESIVLAHSYLMQHDLRPRMHTPSALAEQPQDDTNAELRRVGIQIKSDSDKLAKKWSELKKQVNAWSRIIDDAHAKMEQLAAAIAECQLSLSKMEANMESMQPVEELRLEELADAVDDSDRLKECLARTRMHVDDANDCSGQLLASDIDLAPELTVQLKSINERFAKLKVDVKIRVAALEHAIADFGPSSQHFLMNSVQPPWQRAVSSANHLPYYINHETEMTQWDHPVMVEIMEKLANFNQVKFSAYRTAMKLRAIQKRLCLDLLSLQELDAKLQSLNSTWGEQRLAIKDAVMCLVPLFESAHEKFPHLIRSIPLAVDLFLNFLLNIYDPSRDGTLRTFSFKVALVVLCNANLEDKYKYLYALISTNEGVDQKRLALLLYDIIHIPKFLGESAAFGGSNVEPSVRSCFETVKFSRTISVDDFLAWLKKEPQSVVWLPVMHRLASAEFAKHQAKCNICKMFPIIGLRYRCLQCFNVDVCQNCFFSQRLAKNHKLSHPMQEYCLPTTSGEDVRDFGLIVKNKLRSSSRTRMGYLPVQTVDEGIPIETTCVTPINPLTEPLHNRMHLCAQRLYRARGDDEPPPPLVDPVEETSTVELKSPLQLLSQVEQMHKEELDQVLHKLQHENRELKKEIERRKNFEGIGSTPNLTHGPLHNANGSMASGRSVPSLPNSTDEQLLREAHLLRQHKERLEQRSRILEEQNRQLEVQLARLRTVIAQQQNTGSEEKEGGHEDHELSTASGEDEDVLGYEARSNRMHSLIASVDQLGRAMHSLVASVVNDDDGDQDDDDELSTQ